jgi:hypothetical protein
VYEANPSLQPYGPGRPDLSLSAVYDELHANAKLAYGAYRKANFKSRTKIEVILRSVRNVFVRLFGGTIDPPKKAKPEEIRIIKI